MDYKAGLACGTSDSCADSSGCPKNQCPDFSIKRNDTFPFFKVAVTDCDGALDLTDENLSVTASIWGKAKLKASIDDSVTTIAFADNIGFDQIAVGDIIIMNRVRNTEKMLVESFDEDLHTITVERGYDGSSPSAWSKGDELVFFRQIDENASIETVLENVEQLDGTVLEDQLVESYLVYEWKDVDTTNPGCFWLQFKLTNSNENWTRRFPESSDGFLIKIYNAIV